jgi:hypothetical protein
MSIEAMIVRNCKHTAVYWGNPQNDGSGGKTYDPAVELTPPENGVRWEEMHQLVLDAKGNEVTSRALVFLCQDVIEEGVLYLGTLDSLTAEQRLDPTKVDGAYIIKRFQKTPDMVGTGYLRKAYLTPSLSFGGF